MGVSNSRDLLSASAADGGQNVLFESRHTVCMTLRMKGRLRTGAMQGFVLRAKPLSRHGARRAQRQ